MIKKRKNSVYLRKASQNDMFAIKQCYQNSTALHLPWTYPPKDYDAYLSDENRYFLSLIDSDEIVGTFNISGITRGLFQSAYLGYEVFYPHQNKGYMTRGLELLLEQVFNSLNLHRLEANIQPDNLNSIKLVSKLGFVKEGYSRNYLNIGGNGWKGHERWAIINEDWKPTD